MNVNTRTRLDRKAAAVYRLDPLTPGEMARWDELIAPYEGRELFHQTAWLDYLAATRGIDVVHWAIRADDSTIGYLCGGVLRMGPFRILGSPLRSWGTNVMGPLFEPGVDQSRLLEALDRLALSERLAMTELEQPMLSQAALEGAGFERVGDWTYFVPLTPEEPEAMWRALESTCRNRIRKAQTGGLRVEDTDDPAVVDEYYDFYRDLIRRKGRRPPFGRETPRVLFSHLKKADSLFAMRVTDPAGRLLSVGLFPHDERTMYFWSGASLEEGHPLCPNDLLHWSAMRLAASRGLRLYNMSGYGRFKRKFGGTLTEVSRWHKCYWRTARWARKGYQAWFEVWGARSLWPAGQAKRTEIVTASRHPSFRPSDIYRAPLHDFPIRDEILYQYLPLSRNLDLLEIGPGSGFTAFRLAREVRSLTLVDVASANIATLHHALRLRRNLHFVCADVCQPGLVDVLKRTFDAIYAIEVLEFLPDPSACLQNLAGVLRRGGHLLLQFPNYPPPVSPGVTYFRTKRDLDDLMAKAGFAAWNVASLKLRPYAQTLYTYLHERPIRTYRRRRSTDGHERPLIYDESWAFQHGQRLEPFKYALHLAWAIMSAAMRLGGPPFAQTPVGDDILNRNLIVLARR